MSQLCIEPNEFNTGADYGTLQSQQSTAATDCSGLIVSVSDQ